MQKNLFFIISILLLATSCSSTMRKKFDRPEFEKKTGLEMYPIYLKDKGKKFDIGLAFLNNSNTSIIVHRRALKCFKGDQKGRLGYSTFGIGERVIDLAPDQEKVVKLTCKHKKVDKKGAYKITVRKVLENKSEDGITPSGTFAENLVWEHKNLSVKK